MVSVGRFCRQILMADERDLNRWVSVKRMSQYLRPEEEQHDIKKYKAKASNTFYKQKILQSLFEKWVHFTDSPIQKSRRYLDTSSCYS